MCSRCVLLGVYGPVIALEFFTWMMGDGVTFVVCECGSDASKSPFPCHVVSKHGKDPHRASFRGRKVDQEVSHKICEVQTGGEASGKIA